MSARRQRERPRYAGFVVELTKRGYVVTGVAEVVPRGASFVPKPSRHEEYAGGFTPRVRAAEIEADHEAARREAQALLDGVALQIARRPDLAEKIEREHGAAIAEARALLSQQKSRRT
jgi:hypothetical protein